MSSSIDDKKELAARYFRQLSDAGETEIYLPPRDAETLRRFAGADVQESERAENLSRAGASGGGVSGGTEGAPEPAPGRPGFREALAAMPAPGRRGESPGEEGSSTSQVPPRATGRRQAKASDGARSGASKPPAGPSAAEAAEELPELEIIDVRLAFMDDGSTADMFAGASVLDACKTLEDVEKASLSCEKCELAVGRTNVVFGVGNPGASLMFVGEAPGRDEDLQGIPFVGRAGQLLNKILAAAEIERDDVYIGNIIKCRPPNNRTPLTSEIEACMPYLGKQIEFIKPRIICTLGLPATQTLLGIRGSMASLRGKIYRQGDVRVIPTYHPAAALRDPKYKRPIWEDFLLIKREYERP